MEEKNKIDTANTGAQPAAKEAPSAGGEKKRAKKARGGKRHYITFYVGIATLLVVLASVVTIFTVFLASNNHLFSNVPEVELPVFTQMTTDEVLSNPAYKNFHFDIEEVYSVDSEEGLIIDQSPKAPKSVKENAHITLKVSLGAEEVTVPNVVGWQRDTVRAKFKELGLSILITSEADDSVAPDKVIRTEPAAGTVVDAGDTVQVFVSREDDSDSMPTVPNCVGMTQKEAMQALSRRHLSAVVVPTASSQPEGTVVRQSVSAGSAVARGSSVSIYVSSAAGTLVVGGEPAVEGQQLYPGGPMVGYEDGQVVPGSVSGHIHNWSVPDANGTQVCYTCGATRQAG